MTEQHVVVVGAGLMGAASAWALARRGIAVTVLEQYPDGHPHGSSHGSARIVRRAYGDALYTQLTGRAFELWRELELASGEAVLRMIGGLDFGARRDVASVAAHLAAHSVPHEVLPPDEAQRRWPGMVFDADVVFHPEAGTMDADLARRVMLAQAQRLGAAVRYETGPASVSPSGREVTSADGPTLAASCVVVAAGGWLAGLLPEAGLPLLRVTRQSVFHFPRRDPDAPPWPSVIHDETHAVYHLAGGRDGTATDDRKLGLHEEGSEAVAGTPGVVSGADRELAVNYVRRWLPGLMPEPRGEATCLYTRTPSEDFVLDRVGDVVLCSPCSGHGAKFAPLIGELVADLVTGSGESVPPRFRLAAHRAGRLGSVSL